MERGRPRSRHKLDSDWHQRPVLECYPRSLTEPFALAENSMPSTMNRILALVSLTLVAAACSGAAPLAIGESAITSSACEYSCDALGYTPEYCQDNWLCETDGCIHYVGYANYPNDNACPSTACVPATCNSVSVSCGQVTDGCGGMLDCGPCQSDPFDDSFCSGNGLTLQQAIALFAPGTSTYALGAFQLFKRTRACNTVTGCGAWSAGVFDSTGVVNLVINAQGGVDASLVDSRTGLQCQAPQGQTTWRDVTVGLATNRENYAYDAPYQWQIIGEYLGNNSDPEWGCGPDVNGTLNSLIDVHNATMGTLGSGCFVGRQFPDQGTTVEYILRLNY